MFQISRILFFFFATFFLAIKCDYVRRDTESLTGIRDKLSEMLQVDLRDPKHGIVMGVSSDKCDNAVDNLNIDWDGSPVNYTCFFPKSLYLLTNTEISPVISCDSIPPDYSPVHHCMNETITYDSAIPTHEGHRPLWPVFGEYKFVPPQRWLHNIEHGAVVMLYHPCADPSEVKQLKKLVKSCLWKYVITPWNMLPIQKPLALVAWGCRMEMSYVDPPLVRYFIRNKAFQGPEAHYLKQGQYTEGLIEQSNPPSDPSKDQVLC